MAGIKDSIFNQAQTARAAIDQALLNFQNGKINKWAEDKADLSTQIAQSVLEKARCILANLSKEKLAEQTSRVMETVETYTRAAKNLKSKSAPIKGTRKSKTVKKTTTAKPKKAKKK